VFEECACITSAPQRHITLSSDTQFPASLHPEGLQRAQFIFPTFRLPPSEAVKVALALEWEDVLNEVKHFHILTWLGFYPNFLS
jgi:hypothetical protein